MKFIYESVAETQKSTLDAAASLTSACLLTLEQYTRLHLDATRAAMLRSSQLAEMCLRGQPSDDAGNVWGSAFRSGIEDYAAYCRKLRELAQENAAKIQSAR